MSDTYDWDALMARWAALPPGKKEWVIGQLGVAAPAELDDALARGERALAMETAVSGDA